MIFHCLFFCLFVSLQKAQFLPTRAATAASFYSFSSLLSLRSRRMMRLRLTCIHVDICFAGFLPLICQCLFVSWTFSARVSVFLAFLFSFSFPPQNEEEEKRKKRVKSEAGGRRWDRYWGLIDLWLLCILDCPCFFSSCSNWIIDQR